ncbi:TPA: peroxiredoxin [Candidatus Bipolaricaulota bacterium]|nr:peroxiredoxin [Candidatus Bipolaricaulota bacterium]
MADRTTDVGDTAPDFTLRDQNEGDVALSDFRGKKVVLSFHPLAWTSVCKSQMQDLEEHGEDFGRLDAVALGLSVDSVPCKRAWAEAIGIQETPLLADFWPHGGVAQAYGIFREKNGFSERAVFIVDREGVVRFKKIYPMRRSSRRWRNREQRAMGWGKRPSATSTRPSWERPRPTSACSPTPRGRRKRGCPK